MKEKRHLARTIIQKALDHPDDPALKWKDNGKWTGIDYGEFVKRVLKVAGSLRELGVGKGDNVAIYSDNMPQWAITDLAILSLGAATVPIYATSTSEQARYIIEDSQSRVIFVGSHIQYEAVRPFRDELDLTVISYAPEKGALEFEGFLDEKGDKIDIEKAMVSMKDLHHEDLATIIYTSGTTGEPKGVMLTHMNLLNQVDIVETYFEVGTGDRSLCFLPLSHVFERAWSYFIFYSGAVNHYMDDHKLIREYMEEVKPTVMVSVPRLFEKIYSTANEKLRSASLFKKVLFGRAMKVGWKYNTRKQRGQRIGPYLSFRYRIMDKLVLSKIRAIVGGDKKFFASGGAPLLKEIGEFFLSAGVLICEGYGLTETSPIISMNRPADFRFGTVGRTAPFVDVRLGEDNEIQVKGPNVMKGYYNKPGLTEESFVDGWFRTGDVGGFDDDGFLKITDRIKDLIITSTGKNIATQKVELTIGKDHYIEQILAIGNNRSYLTALVVPYFEALEDYAREKGIKFSSREMLIKKQEIIDFYNQRMKALQTELATFEKIKRFTLLPAEFSQSAGEITPTLKNKRKVIMKKYGDLIENMYSDHEIISSPF